MKLTTAPNIQSPDDLYAALVEALEGLDDDAAERRLFRLIFLLFNQIGDRDLILECIAASDLDAD